MDMFEQHDTDNTKHLRELVTEVIRTKEMRELLGGLAPEVAKIWAGGSFIKKPIAATVGSSIEKGFANRQDMDAASNLTALFEHPEFMKKAGSELPGLLNGIIDSIAAICGHIEAIPAAERFSYITGLLSDLKTEKTGAILNTTGRILNEMYEENPEMLTELLLPLLSELIETTDFGELRDTFSYFSGDFTKLTTLFWESMCRYPAKITSLMSTLPGILNLIVHFLKEMLGQISRLFMSPDMITDYFLALLREVDGRQIGEFINVLGEIARQWTVGSTLLGEPGTPLFSRDLSAFIRDVVETVDMETFNKARKGTAEGKETIKRAFIEILRNNPELLTGYMQTSGTIRNLYLKGVAQKIELAEDIPDEKMTEMMIQSLSGLNTNDMAEIVNGTFRTLNRMWRHDPKFGAKFLRELTNGIDTDEMAETARWVSEDLGMALQPVAKVIIPHLVSMFAAWGFAARDAGGEPGKSSKYLINNAK